MGIDHPFSDGFAGLEDRRSDDFENGIYPDAEAIELFEYLPTFGKLLGAK